MKEIARTLVKKDWNFNVDPCSGKSNWKSIQVNGFENSVTCHCSFANDNGCHVVGIALAYSVVGYCKIFQEPPPAMYCAQSFALEKQNLTGTLPSELVRLPYLQKIDLNFNYLNGTIPSQWGCMKLVNISLRGNRLTGPIPKELGNITTLKSLVLEFNQLSGKLPPELGNLLKLERLLLTSNYFTGNLPTTFSNLITLKDISLDDNQFSGTIPNLIQNWTSLVKLKISDLKGSDSPFPYLKNMRNLKTIVLRSCNLIETIPKYLGNMINLRSLNLFASSMKGNNLGMVPCLGNINCSKTSYSLHINCGGKLISNENITYDDDSQELGPERFNRSASNWIVSSTGHFFGTSRVDYFTWSNATKLTMDNAELYMNARVSPLSLTYYGFCLGNGKYTVNLHFAEIMFTDDQTFSSLGRRVFDIYIQKKLVLKDFNIVKEAGGVGKVVIKKFPAIVNNSALEIRLYWAGKGTTAIPFASVYGPLISAISIKPDFTPPMKKGSSILVAIIVAGTFVTIIVFGIAWWRGCLGWKGSREKELRGVDLQTGLFSLQQIIAATHNFDIAYKIGEGGFGPVYKARESGLAYLHGESRLKIIHRDIKASNVLLDKDLNPKISDFGLAKLDEEGYTHMTTRVAGTFGYMSPEYAMYGHLTDKADVYSFGIVTLEIVCGKSRSMKWLKEEYFSLVDWVHHLKEKGNVMDLVDERLGEDFNKEEVMVMINVALLCTQVSPLHRPPMASVVSMFEGKIMVEEAMLNTSQELDGKKLEYEEDNNSIGQNSESDRYPIKLNSSCIEESNPMLNIKWLNI
ncbi:hypothetical protein VNO77_28093 [Canavalia gladiata]|uniref:non-specific serine/threonine protein kinase n=1 Tax=Canavalia gladiata TaxID=3824 RepID=A0AAN9Q7M4_CANGL